MHDDSEKPEPPAVAEAAPKTRAFLSYPRNSVLAGSLCAGVVVALLLAGHTYWKRGAPVEQRVAPGEAVLAERNIAAAKAAVDIILVDLAHAVHDVEGMPVETLRDIFGHAEAAIDRFVTQTDNDPEIQRSQAVMYRLFAEKYFALAATESAADYARKSLELSRRLAASNPADPDLAAMVGAGLQIWADVLKSQGDSEGALVAFREGLEIRRALAARDPGNAVRQREIAISLDRIGNLMRDRDDIDGAIAAYRESDAIGRALADADPGNSRSQIDLTVGLIKLAQVGDEPRARWTEALAVLRRLDAEGRVAAPDRQRIGFVERQLSSLLQKLGDELRGKRDLPGATAVERERLELMRARVIATPDDTSLQQDFALSLSRYGDLLRPQNDLPGALAAYREGIEVFRNLAAGDPGDPDAQRRLSVILLRYGITLQATREFAPALEALREAADISRVLVTKNPEQIVLRTDLDAALQRVVAVLTIQKDSEGALAAMRESAETRRALAAASPATPARWIALYTTLQGIGDVELRHGDVVAAKTSFRDAATAAERAADAARTADASLPSEASRDTLVRVLGVAAFYAVLAERPDDALRHADAALAIEPSHVWIELNRALAQLVLGRFAQAKAVYLARKDTAKPDRSTLASDIRADFETLKNLGIAVPAIERMMMEIGI
jgi:tetratricopeptide (TPR) repeat protein